MASLNQINEDLAEIEELLKQAKRNRIIALLQREKKSLNSQLELIKPVAGSPPPVPPSNNFINKTIKNYGWEDSSKSVRIYASFPGVGSHDPKLISVNFTSTSFTLQINEYQNANYSLTINNLLRTIKPEASSYRIKSSDVVITLKKASDETWKFLTKIDEQRNEAKTPKPKMDEDDPSKSMMNLMKQMYDEGDDEMKRTIAKAWTESREKQAAGIAPDF